jgi:hypothetical protein
MKPFISLFHCVTRIIFIMVISLINGSYLLSAQDALANGKALNIPFKKYGISVGNSYEFTGIRVNFADKNVKRINGLNVTFWLKKFQNYSSSVNGISIGVTPTGGSMQPINLGVLGLGTSPKNLSGVSLGGLIIGSGGNINGLSMSGLMTMADGATSAISGISISGIGISAEKGINGLAIGGLGIGSSGEINGIAACLAYLSCKKNLTGIGVTPGFMKVGKLKGLALASYAKTDQMQGFSIALFNSTDELHGLQLGVLNYAGNNPKGLRMLPFINLHLRK